MKLGNRSRHALTRWLLSRRGNIAIISGIAMPCIVGFCGMGADVGYWYYRQRVLQAAADIAAFNGAVALSAGSTSSSVTSAASSDAASNGWKSANGTIAVHVPPISGTHQTSNAVEVVLTENESRFFSRMFMSSTVRESVRAVANYTPGSNACMLALDKTAKDALQFWGSSQTTLVGCNVMSDSLNGESLGIGGSAKITAPCAAAAGGISVTATLTLTSCATVTADAKPVLDPYRSLPAPPIPNSCTNLAGNATTASAGKYCNGMHINGALTLNPGVYVISGGKLQLDGQANVSGSGVMFYLTNGATVQINGSAHMNLSAITDTTNQYHGMLFYGDRTQASATQTFNGDSTSVLTGAIYFPSQTVQLNGNYSGANGCMQVVADMISFSGNSTLSANCAGTGLSAIPIQNVQLVE